MRVTLGKYTGGGAIFGYGMTALSYRAALNGRYVLDAGRKHARAFQGLRRTITPSLEARALTNDILGREHHVTKKLQRKPQVLMASFLLAVAISLAAPTAAAQTSFTTASSNAYGWLVSQMASSGLIVSYQRGHIGYTYDEAVAVMAFAIAGDNARARTILTTLQGLQNADGSWYDAYFTKTLRGQDTNKEVGPNMWVSLAVATYDNLTGDHAFDAMAQKNIAWCLQFQQADGGFNGGIDSSGNVLTWASTEHNEDAYAVLNYFGHTTAAANVKAFLDTVVWNGTDGRFDTGRGDPSVHTDVNAWGVLALGASGTHNYADGLTYNRNCCESMQSNSRTTADGFDFNGDANDVWLEGTGQNAEAFAIAGDSADWNMFVSQVVLDQDTSGGVQYSMEGTDNGYFTMSTANAVSSTGWLIIAANQYNPFQP